MISACYVITFFTSVPSYLVWIPVTHMLRLFIFILIAASGIFLSNSDFTPSILKVLNEFNSDRDIIYQDEHFDSLHKGQDVRVINWQGLLPEEEKITLEQYKQKMGFEFGSAESFTVEAIREVSYQSFMDSLATTSAHVEQLVKLPGYIVPVELEEGRQLKSFFLVPYFGACLHYPPPPPNQMVYVQVTGNLELPDINTPYAIEGVLQTGIFEDPLGTSAYSMSLGRLSLFRGEPDDVRVH